MLFCSGIDELLTYHYLVSEYLQCGSRCSAQEFFALGKEEQAWRIWKALFVDRPPLSEAARGVITVLNAMGMEGLVKAGDLDGIRARMAGRSREEAEEEAFERAGVKYAVMTNVVFSENEVEHLRPMKGRDKRYKAALRVDPLLSGDWASLKVKVSGNEEVYNRVAKRRGRRGATIKTSNLPGRRSSRRTASTSPSTVPRRG